MKAKDINKAINWGLGFSAAYFIGTAIAGAIKKHRSQSGASGIGKADGEYVIKAYWHDGYYGNVRIFAGYNYDRWNGEKWAKWYNPLARWSEYEEKIYKTRKGAEKAIEDLIKNNENYWNGNPVELSIMKWEDYINKYIRR